MRTIASQNFKPKSDKLCEKLVKIRKNWQFCTDIVWFLCQNVTFLLNIYAGKIYKSNKKNKKVFARFFDVLTEIREDSKGGGFYVGFCLHQV